MTEAVVLLSGGMDSGACLYRAVREHGAGQVASLFFDWGQRSAREELEAARALCAEAGTDPPLVMRLEFPYSGALTTGEALPADRTPEEIAGAGVAPTFFPGRNLVMIACAYGLAANVGAGRVFFGANADDATGYPDCRRGFLEGFASSCLPGLERDIEIVLPLIEMSKEGIAAECRALGVPVEMTFSCYAPVDGEACGSCDACVLRQSVPGAEE